MDSKVIKHGIVDNQFILALETDFGWDTGIYALIPSWTGKEMPCKFDNKTCEVKNGYFATNGDIIEIGMSWEMTLTDSSFYLKFYENEEERSNNTPAILMYHIVKTVELSRPEELRLIN